MANYNDALAAKAALSDEYLLSEGLIYGFDDKQNIANGSTYTYSFTTGDAPILINRLSLDVVGTRDFIVAGFVGGTVSGGAQIPNVFPRNHYKQGVYPYLANSVFGGRAVDVAGVEFFNAEFGVRDRDVESGGSGGAVILLPNQLYYFSLTNLDQTADTVFNLISSALL